MLHINIQYNNVSYQNSVKIVLINIFIAIGLINNEPNSSFWYSQIPYEMTIKTCYESILNIKKKNTKNRSHQKFSSNSALLPRISLYDLYQLLYKVISSARRKPKQFNHNLKIYCTLEHKNSANYIPVLLYLILFSFHFKTALNCWINSTVWWSGINLHRKMEGMYLHTNCIQCACHIIRASIQFKFTTTIVIK